MGLPALVPAETVDIHRNRAVSQLVVANRPKAASLQPAARIPALDGLRGVAILLVLVRHSVAGAEISSTFWTIVVHGLRLTWSGVDLFFVLSGFLIGGILLDARSSSKYFQTFYIRRAFRILPLYYIFIALYFARHLPIHFLPGVLGDTSPLPIPFLSFVTFTHNFWMASYGWFGAWGIAPTWSLAVEEQFYLTVPLLVRQVSSRSLYIALGGVILAAPVLRAILPHVIKHGDFANYVLMPCRADALSMGVLAALLYRNVRFTSWIKRNAWALHALLIITFAGIVYLTGWAGDQYTPLMATLGLSCLGLFYSCALLSVVCRTNASFERALKFKPLMRLGTLAYCTYLVHPPLMQAARALLRTHSKLTPAAVWPVGGVLGIIVALAIASVSWNFLEKPLLRYGHRFQY